MLDETAGWDNLVIGLRPATRGTKGKVCQSSCLRWCSESGEGIERRVASSPSPQQGACALKHGGSWDKSLPYAEFSYNNSY
jgi:hypothetical protein